MSGDLRLWVLNAKITSCSSHETPLLQRKKRHLDPWAFITTQQSISLFFSLSIYLYLYISISPSHRRLFIPASFNPPALMAAEVTENPLLRGLVDIGR